MKNVTKNVLTILLSISLAHQNIIKASHAYPRLSDTNPFADGTGIEGAIHYAAPTGGSDVPPHYLPFYLVGMAALLAGGKLLYDHIIKSQCEKAINKLQQYRTTIATIATKYAQENVAAYSPQQLEQRFTSNNGTKPSNPSIESEQESLQNDLGTIKKLIATITTEKASWQGYSAYQHAINNHTDSLLKRAVECQNALQSLEQEIASIVPDVNLRIKYRQTEETFKKILNSLESPKTLDQLIRLQFASQRSPYPHVHCVNESQAKVRVLQSAEQKVPSARFSAFVKDSQALRTNLEKLVSKIVPTETYRQQLRESNHDAEVRAQTTAQQLQAAAEKERVKIEAEKRDIAKRQADAQEHANKLKEAEVSLLQQQMIATTANTVINAAVQAHHSDCNKAIAALKSKNEVLQHKFNQAENYIQTLIAQINSLNDTTNNMGSAHTQQTTTLKAQLETLAYEIQHPPFNPSSIDLDSDQPGMPSQFMKWYNNMNSKIAVIRQTMGRNAPSAPAAA